MPLLIRAPFVRSIAWLGLLAICFVTQDLLAQEEQIWTAPVEPVTEVPPGQIRAQLAEAGNVIRATQARAKYGVDGSGLVVAVLDTGINTGHVDFAGRISGGMNFSDDYGGKDANFTDGQGHGSNCAGIVMAKGTQDTGIAPGANVYVYKVLGNSGSGQFAWMRDALTHLRNNRASLGVTAVNMSIGDGQNWTSVPTSSTVYGEIRALIDELRAAGVVFCISAGNSFYTHGSAQGMGFPAICGSSTSVGAVYDANVGGVSYSSGAVAYSTGLKRITPFSQRLHSSRSSTLKTDVFATGAALTAPGHSSSTSRVTMHGTSQASPCVAGVALLIQDYYRERTGSLPTVAQVEGWMLASSEALLDGDDEDDNVLNTNLSFPFVNAEAALDLVHEATGPNTPPTIDSLVAPGAVLTVVEGEDFAADFRGLDADGDELTLEIDGLPSDATLDPPAGTSGTPPFDATLSWTPGDSDVGLHPVTIRFRDDRDAIAELSFLIEVLPGNGEPDIDPILPVTVECLAGGHFVQLKAKATDRESDPLAATWTVNGQVVLSEAVGSDGETIYSANYEHGVHSVDVTVDDGQGGTATAGTTVTVRDTKAPVIVVAPNMIVPADPGDSYATNVVLTPPVVTDAAGHGFTLTDDAPELYPIGETLVRWRATDEEGNVATATQKVTVVDLEAPLLDAPAPKRIRVNCDRGKKFATVRLTAPQATDNAPGVKVTRTPKKNRFPIGKTNVVWTATDASGNAVRQTQTVIVVNRKPVARAGADIVVTTNSENGAYVELDGRKSYDPDGHKIAYLWSAAFVKWSGVKSSTPSGIFPVGSSSVTLAVTDAVGAKKSDIVRVVVKLKRGRPRSSGEDANLAFAQAENSARRALAGEAGAPAATAFAYAGLASAYGDAAGECIRWEEGASDSDAALLYAEMRQLQRAYGEAAAGELFSAYAESGDENLFAAYVHALHGSACASADLQEP